MMIAALLAAPLCLLLSAAPAAPTSPAPAPAASPSPASGPRLLDATAAWRAARWGMTVEEVLKAFPGQAKRLDPSLALADGKTVAVEIAAVQQAGVDHRVHFVFEGGKLALVSLKSLPARPATGGDYDAVKAQLARDAGQAGEERPVDLTVDYREIRFTAGVTAVDVKFLQGTLVLLYHPAGG